MGQKSKEEPVAGGDAHAEVGCGLCARNGALTASIKGFYHNTSLLHDHKTVKTERFDVDALANLLNSDKIDESTKKLLRKYKRMRKNGNQVTVVYEFGTHFRRRRIGRITPENGVGLQGFPSDVRAYLAMPYYFDVDMKNAQPVILLKICKEKGWPCEKLEEYVNNRSKWLENIMAIMNCSRAEAKELCLSVMFGGKPFKSNTPDFVHILAAELTIIGGKIIKDFPEIFALCKSRPHPARTCVALVLQDQERHIFQCLDEFLTEKGRMVGVNIHDGGLVERLDGEMEFPVSLLRDAETHLLNATGFSIELDVKPLVHSFEFKPLEGMKTLYISQSEYETRRKIVEEKYFICNMTNTICYSDPMEGIVHIPMHNRSALRQYNFVHTHNNVEVLDEFLPIWTRDVKARSYNNLYFWPDLNHERDGDYNIYQGLQGMLDAPKMVDSPNKTAIVERFQMLIAINAGEPTREEHAACRDYITKWFALMIQRPWERPTVALIFVNQMHGSGKDTLCNFIGNKVVGKRYFKNIINAETQLFGPHCTAYEGTIFMKLEEVNGAQTRKYADMLKGMVTAESMRINPKNIQEYDIDVFPHIAMTTNSPVPVRTEMSDRRYSINYTDSTYVGNVEFWNETYRIFGLPEAGAVVYDHLMSIDLSGFNPKQFPNTEYRQNLMADEVPLELRFLEQHEGFTDVSAMDLFIEFRTWAGPDAGGSRVCNHFSRALTPYIQRGLIKRRIKDGKNIYSKAMRNQVVKPDNGGEAESVAPA